MSDPQKTDESSHPEWQTASIDPMDTRLLTKSNIIRIDKISGKPDIWVRLRATYAYRLYITHLKKHSFVRRLTIWMWCNLYPAYITVAHYIERGETKRWHPLVKFDDFVKLLDLPTTRVFDATRVETPAPKVHPIEEQHYLVSPHNHYIFPPVYVSEVSDALVYGGTNLIFVDGAAIAHDLYDFERDYTSEELHGRHVIDAGRMRMRLLRRDTAPAEFDAAAAFVDACAPNYAHWLTEVLPRISIFCSLEQFSAIPIIVNDGLHENIMESLALIVGSERLVIALPIGRALRVARLFMTSVIGYVPFERRDKKLANHSHGLFCAPALELMRTRLNSFAYLNPVQKFPSKVYLRRTADGRNVKNRTELEMLLVAAGFVTIETEKLNFIQQLSLFTNTIDIIGSSGAAVANLIFARSATNITIFIGGLEGTSYWYWQNIACATNKSVEYILGAIEHELDGIHSNFKLDLEEVSNTLRKPRENG
jgi:capsular polysaccharide biosynthesis protein